MRRISDALARGGAFVTTVVVFFLAEIGDKTQIATIGLAARFEQLYAVVIGTTRRHDDRQHPGRDPRRPARRPIATSGDPLYAAFVFAALGVATLILR